MPISTTNPPPQPSRRLDILVLGPMGENEDPSASTSPIKAAVEALLGEPEFAALLDRAGVAHENRLVHIPEQIFGQEIIHNILTHIDEADLVIFNLTPKPGEKVASPNVFYELALVNALGLPAILVRAGEGAVPFYARGNQQIRVPAFDQAALISGLRAPLREFLDSERARANFTNDRITQFYGLPLVDISAVVGLATGYYQNFVHRLILEGGFIAAYPKLIRHVVIVRPSAVGSTYPADVAALTSALGEAGYTLVAEKLDPPPNDTLGKIWFEHVHGVVLDIPRTIYPLQHSPRLLSMRGRNQDPPGPEAERIFKQRFHQMGDQLLNRVKAAIRFQMDQYGQQVRSQIVHFSSIAEAPGLVRQLLGG